MQHEQKKIQKRSQKRKYRAVATIQSIHRRRPRQMPANTRFNDDAEIVLTANAIKEFIKERGLNNRQLAILEDVFQRTDRDASLLRILPQMDELRQHMHPDTFEIFERFMGQFREVIVAYLALKRYVTNDVEGKHYNEWHWMWIDDKPPPLVNGCDERARFICELKTNHPKLTMRPKKETWHLNDMFSQPPLQESPNQVTIGIRIDVLPGLSPGLRFL